MYRPVEDGQCAVCPGRDNCTLFQQSKDSAAPFCPVCPESGFADSEEFVIGFQVDRVERLVQERDAGRQLELEALTDWEWDGVLVWDAHVKAHEIAHRQRVAWLFERMAEG